MAEYTYPPLGARVRLVRWSQGNWHSGDLANPDFSITGEVIETPHKSQGSRYLSVVPDEHLKEGIPQTVQFDRENPDDWSISRNHVTVHANLFWQWTWDRLPDPEPAKPLEIEVGDRVRYEPTQDVYPPIADRDPEDIWFRRWKSQRLYTVVHISELGEKRTYTLVEVTPNSNRHNRNRPDEWWGEVDGEGGNVVLVEKATYRKV